VLNYGLGYKDVKRIRETVPGITIVLPARKIREYVWNISRRVDCDVFGTVAWYPEMRNHRVAEGRFFTEEEMQAGASVCVLGSEMVPILFPLESPMGKHVRIGANYYRVVGVMEALGAVPGNSESQDGTPATSHRLFIPLETARLRYGEILIRQRSGSIQAERVELHELTVKVASLENVTRVADAITEILERHHKKKDYEIVVPLELLQSAERTKQIFNIVLGSIAAISLLVGALGS